MSREVHMKLNTDETTNALKQVTEEHEEIHAGNHFYVSGYVTKGDTETIEFVLTTPNTGRWGHLTFTVVGSNVTFDVYEGATGVVGGTPVAPLNNNRNSTQVSVMSVVSDPTSISVDGSQIDGFKFVSSGPFSGSIGIADRDDEIVLKQNTSYLFRITSNAAGNVINYKGKWYEHTNK